MEVPVGCVSQLWSFISFLPFFFLLFTLGLVKGAIIGPIVVCVMVVGNSAVIIGLWPAHFMWTYYCVAKSNKLGVVAKVVVFLVLPIPLALLPGLAIVATAFGAFGYAILAPLFSTFQATGHNFADKSYHCFVDGTWSCIQVSCTVVRDLVDFCFHSYFSYMDELIMNSDGNENGNAVDIELLQLPSCLVALVMGVVVDVPLITAVALWKSPYMLVRGWKRLFQDLIGLETVCLPLAALAILFWPLAVVAAVLASFLSSFFLAVYAALVVHQEGSLLLGLAFVVSAVSLFDEYTNDVLYLRQGSCLPRPRFRRNMSSDPPDTDSINNNGRRQPKLVSEPSRTLNWQIQHYKPVQVWDWLFKSCEANGRSLIRDSFINPKDIEECIVKGDCKKLGVKLPTWTILECVIKSAKSDSSGLLICDGVELTKANGPRDRMLEWLIGPLLIIKEQIKGLSLNENEEKCLREVVILGDKNEKAEEWDLDDDKVRIAQLQAIVRRLQGLVASISRLPTFRRRFRDLVKVLYLETLDQTMV